MRFFLFAFFSLLFSGCLQDREFVSPLPSAEVIRNLRPGLLTINEVFPTGSDTSSEGSDWMEIRNSSDSTVELLAGQFLVADKANTSQAYASKRAYLIPAKGFFLIRFRNGGTDSDPGFILHPDASLSSQGELTAIWFVKGNDTLLLDSLRYPASPDPAKSFGSLTDGGFVRGWIEPSRGFSNNAPLVINEIAPSEVPDWVEIVNPGSQDFLMKAGEWFFSDDPANRMKDTLKKDFILPAGGYRLVECNTAYTDADKMQVAFSLSSTNGETFGIYRRMPDGSIKVVSEVSFPPGISSGSSFARNPDRIGAFQITSSPSPGRPNP